MRAPRPANGDNAASRISPLSTSSMPPVSTSKDGYGSTDPTPKTAPKTATTAITPAAPATRQSCRDHGGARRPSSLLG